MLKFEKTNLASKDMILCAIESENSSNACNALVSAAFYESDWRWVQARCLESLKNKNHEIACVAATCLGHIARVHGKIDRDVVLPALEAHRSNSKIMGCAEDAIDDIEMFAKTLI